MTRISNTPRNRIHVETSRARTAASDPSSRFGAALERAAGGVLAGVESLASVVPGGAAVSAMVREGVEASSTGGSGASATTPGANLSGGESSNMSEIASINDNAMEYLELQQRVQADNQRYTTLSNVMKARHETAKSAINNIR